MEPIRFSYVTADLPRWIVSAAHRLSREKNAQPFGVHHAREVGAHRTACGEPALGWPYFWDTAFVTSSDSCSDCVRAVRSAPEVEGPIVLGLPSAGEHHPETCSCGHLMTSFVDH
jgi:hypothetical protein